MAFFRHLSKKFGNEPRYNVSLTRIIEIWGAQKYHNDYIMVPLYKVTWEMGSFWGPFLLTASW